MYIKWVGLFFLKKNSTSLLGGGQFFLFVLKGSNFFRINFRGVKLWTLPNFYFVTRGLRKLIKKLSVVESYNSLAIPHFLVYIFIYHISGNFLNYRLLYVIYMGNVQILVTFIVTSFTVLFCNVLSHIIWKIPRCVNQVRLFWNQPQSEIWTIILS